MHSVQSTARQVYEEALKRGIAKEQARCVLPEGLTMSRMYMSGSIRSFYHFCDVRTDPSTQKEHRHLASKIKNILSDSLPNIFYDNSRAA